MADITARIIADTTGLQSSFQQARASVVQAERDMAEAVAQFGKAAEGGNVQAAAALKEYESALASARSSLAAFAATEQEEGIVLRNTISARMAASSELRVLEGNLMGSTRAAGALLTMLPGVGVALQAAFLVFGVIALVEVLSRGVEAIFKWGNGLDQLSEKDKAVHDQMIHNAEDELRHSTQLIKAQYDLAIASTNSPIEKAQLRVQMETALVDVGEKRVSQLQTELSRLQEISKQQQLIADQWRSQTQLLAGGGMSGASGAGTVGTAIMASLSQAKAIAPFSPGPNGEPSEIQKTKNAIEEAQAAVKESQAGVLNAQAEVTKAYEKTAKAAEEVARKNEALAASAQRSVIEVANQQREIQNQQIEYSARLKQAMDLTNDPSVMEQLRRSGQDQAQILKEQTEQYRLQAEEKIKAASEQYRGTEQRTQIQVAQGTLSPADRVRILQQEAAQEYAAQMEAIKQKEELDRGYLDKYQQDLNAQEQLTRAYYQKQESLSAQYTSLTVRPFVTAADQIENAWVGAFNRILIGGQQSWHAMAQLGQQVALSLIDDAERWAIKWDERELLSLVLHQQTNAEKAASDASASAASAATASAANVAQATSYSAVAVTGAAASQAFIPIVGPELAVAAAATMSASLAPFVAMAAFEEGTGFVPKTGLAVIHKGEAVIPAPTMEQLRGNTGGGQTINYSPTFTSHSTPTDQRRGLADLRKMARAANINF